VPLPVGGHLECCMVCSPNVMVGRSRIRHDSRSAVDRCSLAWGENLRKYVHLLLIAVLAAASVLLAGPVVWRWGRRHIAAMQSQARWEAWCEVPGRDIGAGDPCGWLSIPSCGIDTLMLSGASQGRLAKSVCMESVEQGADVDAGSGAGSLQVILGHRDTHFRRLRNIRKGSELALQESNGEKLHYRVVDIEVVDGTGVDDYIKSQNHPGWVVLLTCYPFRYIGHAPERYVVWAAPVDG